VYVMDPKVIVGSHCGTVLMEGQTNQNLYLNQCTEHEVSALYRTLLKGCGKRSNL
jgi:hypothetical protein